MMQMPKRLTIAEAQATLPELVSSLATEPAVITKDGKPVMIALSLEQFESLMETMEIMGDRGFMEQLRSGIRQADAGETISLEELKAELGF